MQSQLGSTKSKKMNNTQFYNMIHRRGITVTGLCKKAGCGRVHLTLVLNGKREGRYTWPKLRKELNDMEYECAFKYAETRLFPKSYLAGQSAN